MTDEEYRRRVGEWVQTRHAASHGCPVCDGRALHVAPPLLMAPARPALIPVTCAGCGHVLLFDAEALGLSGQPDGRRRWPGPTDLDARRGRSDAGVGAAFRVLIAGQGDSLRPRPFHLPRARRRGLLPR